MKTEYYYDKYYKKCAVSLEVLRQGEPLQHTQTDHEVVVVSTADGFGDMQDLRFVEGRGIGSIGEVELDIDPVTNLYMVE